MHGNTNRHEQPEARPRINKEICSFTGLRGVAATLVMIDHYAALTFDAPFPGQVLPHMYVAVDIFMILSGFVLAMTYESRFQALGMRAGFKMFLERRIARLYPLYALTVLICFVLCRLGWLTFLNPNDSLAALGANLLAIQTWAWPGSSLNGPGWSVSAEWAANLLFPLFRPVLLSRSARRAALGAGAAATVLFLCSILYGQLFDQPVSFVVNMISGPGALGRCVSEFALGLYAWRLRSRTPWASLFGRDWVQTIVLGAMALMLIEPRLDVAFTLLAVFLVLGLSYEQSRLSQLLGSAPLRQLGVISYSIYLVHIPLLPVRDALATVLARQGVGQARAASVLCTAALVLAVASLSYRYVEQPARRWINRAFAVRQTRSPHRA